MSNEPIVVYATSKKYATNGVADARSFVSSFSPSRAGANDRQATTLTSLQTTSCTNKRRTQTRNRELRHETVAFGEKCRKNRSQRNKKRHPKKQRNSALDVTSYLIVL